MSMTALFEHDVPLVDRPRHGGEPLSQPGRPPMPNSAVGIPWRCDAVRPPQPVPKADAATKALRADALRAGLRREARLERPSRAVAACAALSLAAAGWWL